MSLINKLNQKFLNTDIYFTEVKQIHLNYIELPRYLAIASQTIHLGDAIMHQSQNGPSCTAFYKHRPIAIFGCCQIWKGLAEAWMVNDVNIKDRKSVV